ncbi:ABC transporter ATP-binding protein [Methylobrevis albus]|uniref:ABC transporter ATP-binding protein n=1 Tax=Methylobrevis albus TaxID=2793297 RepID=A0A931MZQ2_9HYPH|nr:ABC transporter ATP-binding protein [Methylobrevis albus]MBH0237986.1 ABC transporter ATP-binding protein [Methylobrevis albus]
MLRDHDELAIGGEPAGGRLELRDITVRHPGPGRDGPTVWNVTLTLEPGRILGLAGESGCGKSTTAKAAIGFRRGGEEVSGASVLSGLDLLGLAPDARRRLWGNRISYVSQSASLALNPSMRVGRQLAQPLRRHRGLKGAALAQRQVELFEMVGIPNPQAALKRYPFQFSGGQQQRIALAIALCCDPEILILDEPTTGLDVTTQARISALLRDIADRMRIAVLYVSHDLALLANLTDRLAVMYAGEIVEEGPTRAVIAAPRHPYTKILLGLSPRIDDPRLVPGIPGIPPPTAVLDHCAFAPRCPYAADACHTVHPAPAAAAHGGVVRCLRADELSTVSPEPVAFAHARDAGTETLLIVDQVRLHYRNAPRPSVDDVSFKLAAGEWLGIVGESGSGKSSILKMISGLVLPTEGYMRFGNIRLDSLALARPRELCRTIQLVFQNPDASLNPRHSIRQILMRPLVLFRGELGAREREAMILAILDRVRLPASVADRMPHHLSGGQRQRVAIARAFLARPQLLLCDEVTSALDVSVQATVLQMIADLSAETGAAVILVSHDLALVRTMADRIIVMKDGMVVEQAASDALFADPQSAYTRELIAAIPRLGAA